MALVRSIAGIYFIAFGATMNPEDLATSFSHGALVAFADVRT